MRILQCELVYRSFILYSLNAFVTTKTELRLIAAAPIIGERVIPKKGKSTPAAIGMPIIL